MQPVLQIIFEVLSVLSILSVLIPFIKNDYWTFRVFDYPRFQKFCILSMLTILWFFLFPESDNFQKILLGLQVLCIFYLIFLIVPYTFLGKKMIEKTLPDANEKPLNLLVCNVYQDNTEYGKLSRLIKAKDPDVVFLLETDENWKKGIEDVTDSFPFKIEVPLDNTYGLLFYSKLKLLHSEIKYLISTEIPSIVADIEYNGKPVRLYGIHPTPPVPQENEESTERDAEILLVGKQAKEYKKPAIVFGDLNDVAWSHTTKLFLKTSGLLDARRGRGMFNTFHVKYWFLRWPLDHFFVSAHFRLVNMKVEKSVGSDHFPISISLVLRSPDNSQKFDADAEDHVEAQEKIEEGKEKGDASN
ncbi:endonuclease/exonuclease/phosphatase [Elizabethkingia meningoseptica]|uniref:endonuclease/exonuclease/phosphatase family protein n=1 Tax=Elizabethkingia meningoseptica TaxID=238 RepID=UPI000999DF77|nr:endonuclease/exonuclease/phosphatase family protein [Elizabethkingia meningoseptica]OPC25574.1 endonuclease/exonuclease/phosphatase [Elizabethkingia meningoseptica]